MPSQVDQEKYEAVRSAVITACPELKGKPAIRKQIAPDVYEVSAEMYYDKPVQLSHVLRAMREARVYDIIVATTGWFYKEGGSYQESLVQYDLANDDLSKQSPELIQFLYDVICK